jgi:hypothetical protein
MWALQEPYPENGGALVLFINEQPEDIHLLSFQVEGEERLRKLPSAEATIVRVATTHESWVMESISERQGRRIGRVTYHIGPEGVAMTGSFVIDLLALEQCDLRVTFGEAGMRAAPCANYRPASYGGNWRH